MAGRLLPCYGGDVVTQEGEYLGTWQADESDAIFEFTPHGADKPLLSDGFVKCLCDSIEQGHSQQKSGEPAPRVST